MPLIGESATTFLSGIKHDVEAEPNVVIIRNAIYHVAYGKFIFIS
jgi:hypothetical protein